jgi:pimeloyl-ACP methyl ester carboxylesterase
MAEFIDGYWWSNDGLRLHYRDYPGRSDRPAIICLSGLTRNARDHAALAARLSGAWRVIAVDFRGRGESAYAKDPMSYAPLVYVQDIEALLAELGLQRFIAFGTSLGGLVTMMMAATAREKIEGVLLNDVGPELEPAGLARIRTSVGRGGSFPTWLHAARALGEANGAVYPGYALADWLTMAKRLYRLNSAGRVVLDYDQKIAEPLRLPGGDGAIDLWPALDHLVAVPGLLLRGALSDVLSAAVLQKMAARLPLAEAVTVAGVGHPPTLDEPDAIVAIDRLLARIAERN